MTVVLSSADFCHKVIVFFISWLAVVLHVACQALISRHFLRTSRTFSNKCRTHISCSTHNFDIIRMPISYSRSARSDISYTSLSESTLTLYVGLARAVSPTNTNFFTTQLQEALYEDLPV